MPTVADIPQEAVRAVAEILRYREVDASGEGDIAPVAEFDEEARELLEAAAPFIAERIAAEIERVVASGDQPRPRYERGGFFNDANWAALIARTAFPKETDHV